METFSRNCRARFTCALIASLLLFASTSSAHAAPVVGKHGGDGPELRGCVR